MEDEKTAPSFFLPPQNATGSNHSTYTPTLSPALVPMSMSGGTRLPFTPARSPPSHRSSVSVSRGRRGSLLEDSTETEVASCTCPVRPIEHENSNVPHMRVPPGVFPSPANSRSGPHSLTPYHAITSPSHSFFQRSQSGAATPSSELGLGFAISPTCSDPDLGSLDPANPSLPSVDAPKVCPTCGKLSQASQHSCDNSGASPLPSKQTNRVPSLLTICMDLLASNLDQVRGSDLSFLPHDQVQPLVDRLAASREITPRALSRFARRAVYRLYLDHGGGADWLPLVGDMPLRELSLSFCNGIVSTQPLSAKKVRQRVESHSGTKKRFRKDDHIAANLEVFRVEACPFVASQDLMVASEFRNLRVLQFIDSDHVTNKVLMSLTTLKKLEELRVQGASKITTFGFQKCLHHLANLRRLHIEQCPKITSLVGSNINSLPNLLALTLRALRIKNQGLAPLADLTSLTELDLYDMKLEDDGLLQLSSLTSLRHLCVSHTQVNDSVAQLPDFAPGLTSLYLSGCKRLERERLRQCLSRLRELRKLKVRKVGAVNASVLMALSAAAKSLTHLNISECDVQLSAEAVAQFPSLTTLICRQTNFAPNTLPALAKHCPRLSSLDLSRCSIPKDTDFLALRDLPGLTHLDLSYALFTNTDLRSPASRAMHLTSREAQIATSANDFIPQLSPCPSHFSISNGLSTLSLGASQVHTSTSTQSGTGMSPAFGGDNSTPTRVPVSDRGSAFSPRNSSDYQFPHPAKPTSAATDSPTSASKSSQKPRNSSRSSMSMFASGSTIFSVLATNTPTRSAFSESPQASQSARVTPSEHNTNSQVSLSVKDLPATHVSLLRRENVHNADVNIGPLHILKPAPVLPLVQSVPLLKKNDESTHISPQSTITTQTLRTPKCAFSAAHAEAPIATHHAPENTPETTPMQHKATTNAADTPRIHRRTTPPSRVVSPRHPVLSHSFSVPANIMLPPVSEEKCHTKEEDCSSRRADEEHKTRSPLSASNNSNNFDLRKGSATPSPPNSYVAKSSASTPSSARPNPLPKKPSPGSNPPTPLSLSFPSPTMSYRRSGKKRRRRRSGVAASQGARAASNASSSSFLSSLNAESNDMQNNGGIAPPLQLPGSLPRSESLSKWNRPPRSPTIDVTAPNSDAHSAVVSGRRASVRQSPLMSPSLKPAHSRSMPVSSHPNDNAHALLCSSTNANTNSEIPRSFPPSSPTPTPLRRTPSFSRRRSRSRLISTASPTMASGVAFVGRSRSGSRAASPPPNFPFAAIVAPLMQLRILRLKNCKVGGSLIYLVEGSVFPSMFKLNLSNCQLCDRDMSLLVNFPNLLWLHTKNSPDVTARGFAVLARLTKLQHLSLEGCIVDGDCMESFPPSLTYLDLNLTFPSSDPGVRTLSRLRKLQYLSLLDCHLTDKFVSGVTRHLPDLYSLVLCRSHLTPHGLEDLKFLAQEHRFVVKLNQYDQRKHDWKVVESFGPHSA